MIAAAQAAVVVPMLGRRRSTTRRWVARTAIVAGVLVVGTGTAAAAGALPDGAQSAIARFTTHIGLDLPDPGAVVHAVPPVTRPATTTSTTEPHRHRRRRRAPHVAAIGAASASPAAAHDGRDLDLGVEQRRCEQHGAGHRDGARHGSAARWPCEDRTVHGVGRAPAQRPTDTSGHCVRRSRSGRCRGRAVGGRVLCTRPGDGHHRCDRTGRHRRRGGHAPDTSDAPDESDESDPSDPSDRIRRVRPARRRPTTRRPEPSKHRRSRRRPPRGATGRHRRLGARRKCPLSWGDARESRSNDVSPRRPVAISRTIDGRVRPPT